MDVFRGSKAKHGERLGRKSQHVKYINNNRILRDRARENGAISRLNGYILHLNGACRLHSPAPKSSSGKSRAVDRTSVIFAGGPRPWSAMNVGSRLEAAAASDPPLQIEVGLEILGVVSADQDFRAFPIAHDELITAARPRKDFSNVVQVDQMAAVRAEETER